MSKTASATHPMIIVAATTVTIAGLITIASSTGLLAARATPAPEALLASAAKIPAATPAALPAKPAEATRPAAAKPAPPPRAKPASHDNPPRSNGNLHRVSERGEAPARADNDNAIDVIPARRVDEIRTPVCRDCGTVEAVNEISTPADGSGLGAIAGGVVGGLLGNQVGKGRGSQVAAVLGALGGAYAGHEVEKRVRAEKQVEITVRLDDGSVRTLTQPGNSRWHHGDRVRMSNGSLLPV